MATKRQREALENLAKRARQKQQIDKLLDRAAKRAANAGCSTREVGDAMGVDNATVWRRYYQ